MASIRTSFFALLAISLLIIVSQSEARPSSDPLLPRDPWKPSKEPASLSGYNVPLTNGGASLPPPTGTLKAIVLGQGTQNYTCKPSNTTTPSVPVAIGAKATLFDASPFLQLFPSPEAAMPFLNRLPEYLMWLVDIEANLHANLLSRYHIPTLGNHIFNAAGQPVFDLGTTGSITAKKTANISAPASACAGPPGMRNYGAVDWLSLVDVGNGASRGLKEVYRISTAGGKAPPTCEKPGTIEVPYAALYWFFE